MNYRPEAIKLTWIDTFTLKELASSTISYDPVLSRNGYYRKIATAWKSASGHYRRAGILHGKIKIKVDLIPQTEIE